VTSSLAILALVLGGAILLALYWWSRERLALAPAITAEASQSAVMETDGEDGLLVTNAYGHLLHINAQARRLFAVTAGQPSLEALARQVRPERRLLELVATGGAAALQINGTWLEAVAHHYPAGSGTQVVVALRAPRNTADGAGSVDLSRALRVIGEIEATINVAMGMEPALQIVLDILNKTLPASAGEITLWDESGGRLVQRGWIGDTAYLVRLAERGGAYAPGEGVPGWVARYRQGVLVRGDGVTGGLSASLADSPYRSAIATPLNSGEGFLGVLTLYHEHVAAFAEDDAALLEAVGQSVAVVVTNAQIYLRQEERIRDIASLQEIAELTSEPEGRAQVYRALNERVAKLLDAEIAGVLLIDSQREAFVGEVPFHGLSDGVVRNVRVPVSAGSIGANILMTQPYWVSNDAGDEPLIDDLGLQTIVMGAGLRHIALFPLQVSGERFGLLLVANLRNLGGFMPRDIQNLRVLATQAAIVVENLRLADRGQQIDAELLGVQEMTEAISSLGAAGDFYQELTERIARLTGSAICAAFLFDPATEQLVVQPGACGVPDASLAGYTIPLNPDSPLGEPLNQQAVWFSNHVATDERIITAGLDTLAEQAGITRTLIALIQVGGRRLGALQVANKRDGSDYDAYDGRRLLSFAAQAGAAIENLRLVETTGQNLRQRVLELNAISHISRTQTETTDIEQILAVIREEALVGTGAAGSTIVLLTPKATWARTGEPIPLRRLGRDIDSLILADVEREAALHTGQVQQVADYREAHLQPQPPAVRSALAAPILTYDEPVAVLHVFWREANGYEAGTVAFLETLATKAALGFQNALRHEEQITRSERLRQRVDQLNRIFELGQMLQTSTDAASILEAIAYSVQISVGFDSVLMLEYQPAEDSFRRVAQAGMPLADFEATRAQRLGRETLAGLLQADYRVGAESYFFPLEQIRLWDNPGFAALRIEFEGQRTVDASNPGAWRNGDVLVVGIRGAGGELLALMSLDRPYRNDRPDSATIEVLEIFAHQAASMLDNTRLFALNRDTADRLRTLTALSTAVTATLEREDVIRAVLTSMADLVGFDGLTLWERQGPTLTLIGAAGPAVVGHRIGQALAFSGHLPLNAVIETRQPQVHGGTPALPGTVPGEAGAASWLGTPLVSQGQVIGVIVLTAAEPDRYHSLTDQYVVQTYCTQVAIALTNADLFAQMFARTNELGTLLEAARMMASGDDLHTLFAAIAEVLFDTLAVDRCVVWLLSERGDQLEKRLDAWAVPAPPPANAAPDQVSLAVVPGRARLLREGDLLALTLVGGLDQAGVDAVEAQAMRDAGILSRLLVPIRGQDQQPLGLLQIDQVSVHPGDNPDARERIAQALASQLAVSIRNARLVMETGTRFEELITINTLSQTIASTLDQADMLAAVMEGLPVLVTASDVVVALYDEFAGTIAFPAALRDGVEWQSPPQPLGDDEYAHIIRHGQALSLSSEHLPIEEGRRRLGITTSEPAARSFLGVPMQLDGELFGVLAVSDRQRAQAFSQNDARILSSIGAQIAASVRNAFLIEQMQTIADDLDAEVNARTRELSAERDRLGTLYRISTELARTLDMDALLGSGLEMIAAAVEAEDGAIFLMNPATDALTFRAGLHRETGPQPEAGRPTHLAEALASRLVQSEIDLESISLVVDDIHRLPDWEPTPGTEQWRSALAVILETSDDPLGVLLLVHRAPGQFNESQAGLVQAASSQIAASINSADLYQLIRDQADRLGRLLRAEQEEAQKQTAIVESIADGVLLADAGGQIVTANSAARRILGVSGEDLVGQSSRVLTDRFGVQAADLAAVIRNWSSQREASDGLAEYRIERVEMGARIVSAAVSPVYFGREYLGTVFTIRDVTRDVEIDRAKSAFIENVSHEFRTPLTPIKGYTDLLLMGAGGPLDATQAAMIRSIKQNVDRLTVLVNDVLDIARLDSAADRLQIEAVDLQALVPNLFNRVAGRALHIEAGYETSVQVDAEVPLLYADREMLMTALTNLLENAFHYTPSGGTITMAVHFLPERQHVRFEIRDTGVGIPEAAREAVWQRFERHQETALELDVSGTGLGLPIVREIVTRHRGRVWFESDDGGTLFTIDWPTGAPADVRAVRTAEEVPRE
jgi:PAS domain S-box-containing protein